MSEPLWIDELKERYLADAGNVFLLYGPVGDKIWAYDGETLDCAQVLVRFLRRTREIVAVLRPAPIPSRLEFSDVSDRARFENLVKAYDLLQGRALPLVETDPLQALGRVWRALSTTGTDQAYIITDADRLLPGHRKRLDPVPGAPELIEWPNSPVLQRSNNLVLFLAPTREQVRIELADAAVCIDLAKERRPRPAETQPIPADLEEPETPPPPPELAPSGDLREDLAHALESSLATHPAEHRAALLPVMEAVARVVASRRPGFRVPTFGLNAEGEPLVTGPDAETFLALWRSDIALDAAATMLTKSWSANGGSTIDDTGLSALVRRVERLLAR